MHTINGYTCRSFNNWSVKEHKALEFTLTSPQWVEQTYLVLGHGSYIIFGDLYSSRYQDMQALYSDMKLLMGVGDFLVHEV